jgi:hypothetical protein
MQATETPIRINARTFQEPLARLADTMVEKVFREGFAFGGWPAHVSEDIAMMLRYSRSIYNLLFYLNADERRSDDYNWTVHYCVSAMSLVRSLIDCLYNVTAILQNPAVKGPEYRKSGLKKVLSDLEAEHQAHLGDPSWDAWYEERRGAVELLIRASGFVVADVEKHSSWPTLGAYVGREQTGATLTDHQKFLKTFTHLEWRQYSALSHGSYEAFTGILGHIPIGAYYVSDFLPHENRLKVDESYDLFRSTHIGRAATVLLCLLTEIQAYCRFDGANINDRVAKIWEVLILRPEVKELYDGRYATLMIERGISPQKGA